MTEEVVEGCFRHQSMSMVLYSLSLVGYTIMLTKGLMPTDVGKKNFFKDNWLTVVANGSANVSTNGSAQGPVSGNNLAQLTPPEWATVIVWAVVYICQFLWMTYTFAATWVHCKYVLLGSYVSPCVLFPLLRNTFMTLLFCTMMWLLIWSENGYNLYEILGCVFFVGLFLVVVDKLCYMEGCLRRRCAPQEDHEAHLSVMLVRSFVANGVGFFITWTALPYLGELACWMMTAFSTDPNAPVTCYLILIVTMILVIAAVDFLTLDLLTFTFAPYVLVCGWLFVMANTWHLKAVDLGSPILVCAAFMVSVVVLLVKVIGSFQIRSVFPKPTPCCDDGRGGANSLAGIPA